VIKANQGHIFGGYSDLSWCDEIDINWKTSLKAFLFTISDDFGRNPTRLSIREGKYEQALYHSRNMLAFG